jgi:hypothetical protein
LPRPATLTALFLLAFACLGQDSTVPTLRSASTLVALPALVRLPTGELVKDLDADRFQLFDDGAPQKLTLERTEKQPIAMVILMQTGGQVIGLFQQEPGNFRRIVLLLSQSRDDGSTTSAEEVVRQLGESSTSVYCLTFLPRKAAAHRKQAASADRRHSTPLGQALKAMETNTAETIATLSGGEQLRFRDDTDFEQQWSAMAEDIHNRYLLSFQPNSHQPGFHSLTMRVAGRQALRVTARTSYWFDVDATGN